MNFRHFFLLAFILILATGCVPAVSEPSFSDWDYADLSALDDSIELHAGEPYSADLQAVYARQSANDITLRLDFFDHPQIPDYDLYLAFDALTGGSASLPIDTTPAFAWDTLIMLPAAGEFQALDPQMRPRPGARLQVLRDPLLDTLILNFSPSTLPVNTPNWRLQAWVTPPGSRTVVDALPVIRSGSRPPQPVRAVMAFSQTYTALTPALALRRWDGAHTGPNGGRHGLSNLLRVASANQVPLFLLDLSAPASLSALDYQGGLEQVKALQTQGLLVLPESRDAPAEANGLLAPGIPLQPKSQYTLPRQAIDTNGFGLATANLPAQSLTVLTLHNPEQASKTGPTLELRQALAQAAASTQNDEEPGVLALGGALPASAWGDPQAARATLRYLRSRPWIQFLNRQDLLALPRTTRFASVPGAGPAAMADQATSADPVTSAAPVTGAGTTLSIPFSTAPSPGAAQLAPLQPELLRALQQSSPNSLTAAAAQAFAALSAPVYPMPENLAALRANYQGNVWTLLAAARWADDPQPRQDCSDDIDHDGQAECVLASTDVMAVFEQPSGMLTFLFARVAHPQTGEIAPHQLVGPSSQMISGLSDPSTWDLSRGASADPAVIPGAFAGAGQSAVSFPAMIPGAFAGAGQSVMSFPAHGMLSFVSSESGVEKAYQLTPTGLVIRFSAPPEVQTTFQIPVLLDPWLRFQSGWADRYSARLEQQTWTGAIAGELRLVISSSTPLAAASFLDTRDWMSAIEDPNREQPAGHFLPFPLSLVSGQALGSFQVELQALPEP